MVRKRVIRRKDIVIAACLGLIAVAAAVAVRIEVLGPARARSAKAKQELDEAKQAVHHKDKRERELHRLEKESAELRAQLAEFDKRMPDRRRRLALTAELAGLAKATGLQLRQIRLGEPVAVGRGIEAFPYELEVEGSYHDVARFMARIESHQVFLRIIRTSLAHSGEQAIVANLVAYVYGTSDAPQGEAGDDGPGEARGA